MCELSFNCKKICQPIANKTDKKLLVHIYQFEFCERFMTSDFWPLVTTLLVIRMTFIFIVFPHFELIYELRQRDTFVIKKVNTSSK